MNWAYFIEKQQQQQYAITKTTKQKNKQNQTNKQTVEKTKTAKTFRFNEMIIYLRNINICIFFSDHKPPGGGCCQILAIVCATVKGMVFKLFTLGKAQSKSESLGLEKGNISQETDQLVVWTTGKPRVPLKFDFAGAPRVPLTVLRLVLVSQSCKPIRRNCNSS